MPAVGSPAFLTDKHRTSYLGFCLHDSSHGKISGYLKSEGERQKNHQEETGRPLWKMKALKTFTGGCQGVKQTQTHVPTSYPRKPQVFFTTKPGNKKGIFPCHP